MDTEHEVGMGSLHDPCFVPVQRYCFSKMIVGPNWLEPPGGICCRREMLAFLLLKNDHLVCWLVPVVGDVE
jgi:hypothetical protein